ncbi:FAD-dependent oxidoreductase [Kriegella sp. EG-1]|nr:FAD-dependent oxidoreductase [Flavobacteriaceae bacterium EG-1]
MIEIKKSNTSETTNKWDTIVIGAGAGGLATAICLSKAGQKVLVLEKHDVPGGWCHSFYLDGHRFTPGVHYVGLLEEGETTNNLYSGLGIASELTFFRMNPNGYEHCRLGDEKFDYPNNFDLLIERLQEKFPKEKKNIATYLNLIKTVSEEVQMIPHIKGFWNKLFMPYKTRHMGKHAPFTLNRIINRHIKDPLLKRILNIQCGDHALAPNKVSFLMHAGLMTHYFSGGFYPMGGGGALIKSMTNAIKRNNGEVWTSNGVQKILIEDASTKKAVGVELEDGRKIYANRIVSNTDPDITYKKLIGEKHLSKKLLKKLNKTKYSCTSLMLFMTIDYDLRKAGLDSGNIWMMPNRDENTFYAEMMNDDLTSDAPFEGMFISCTSLKDPSSFDGRYHTLEAITLVDYSPFEKFKNESEQRSQEYLDFKNLLTKKMLKGLETVIPNISKHIVQLELGTPITNEYYVNTTQGSIYGTEKSLWNIGPFAFKNKSEIENLYLCGSSVLSHGVAGASHSGVDTAAQILGCTSKDLIKPDPSQQVQLFDAEDDSNYPEWLQKKINLKRARAEAKV